MPSIRILSKNLTNQIAAGEVVERPFSVVKELIENALDAQATEIIISVAKGGKEKIEVRDNGTGMDEDDAKMSVKRFATSKIIDEADLFHIHTFGFRGEALPSIASISLFTLQTKQKEMTEGVEIRMKGGEIVSEKRIAFQTGTRVCVEHLFYNTPARMKYLKSDSTELSHIVQYVTEIALSHPHISFMLSHNEKTVFRLEKQKTQIERVKQIFGDDMEKELIPVVFQHEPFSLSGFISHPRYSRQNNKYEFLSINHRPVKNITIHKAILEGYDRTIEKGSYPFFVLNLSIDPTKVDVNAHPRKLEVRFEDNQRVFQFFRSAIHTTLQKSFLARKEDTPEFKNDPVSPIIEHNNYSYKKASWSNKYPRSPYATPTRISSDQASFFHKGPVPLAEQFIIKQDPVAYEETKLPEAYFKKILGQVHKCYILFETTNGFGIIDQHAAHEIVLFRKIKEVHEKQSLMSQALLTPLEINIPLQRISLYEEYSDLLSSLGFETRLIGKQSILLSSVPIELTKTDVKQIFLELLDECEEYDQKSVETLKEKMYATMACRAAIKFGDALSSSEQESLLLQFSQLEKGYSCPHGRPVIKEFSLEEMLKWFDR